MEDESKNLRPIWSIKDTMDELYKLAQYKEEGGEIFYDSDLNFDHFKKVMDKLEEAELLASRMFKE